MTLALSPEDLAFRDEVRTFCATHVPVALRERVRSGLRPTPAQFRDWQDILYRQGGEVRAWLNVCPHAGRRLDWAPGRFLIDPPFLVCAAHGACFSMPDGLCVSGPCRGQSLSAVVVEVRDGEIFV